MARWSNFSIWRGRLPHWRADGVTYYLTFRHRRPLEEAERHDLFTALLKPQGRKWDVVLLCVLPERTEMLVTVEESPAGGSFELSDIAERAKAKAGKAIVKRSGERYPPFYGESYDRIVRDEAELRETWVSILDSPVSAGLAEDPGDYAQLWAQGHEAPLSQGFVEEPK
jgi:REP-associated tyrosine transposase